MEVQSLRVCYFLMGESYLLPMIIQFKFLIPRRVYSLTLCKGIPVVSGLWRRLETLLLVDLLTGPFVFGILKLGVANMSLEGIAALFDV